MKYLQTFENHILNYRIGDKLTCKRDYYSMCKVGQEFEIVEINRHYSKPMYQITNGKLLLPLTKDEFKYVEFDNLLLLFENKISDSTKFLILVILL